ncbi:MAG: hypothetical protein V1776_01575 [Candidatus Diapherotrites archaeon]
MMINGNRTTALMHLLVWTELQRIRVNQVWPITRMTQEQTVLLQGNNHQPKEGKFDFYVETPQKTIGFEVLTRPSKGKILKKMAYRQKVDEFVFVIPKDALLPYQKTSTIHAWKVRPKFLPEVFGEKGLYAWLIDLGDRQIIQKKPFPFLYNIETHTNGNGKNEGKTKKKKHAKQQH